MSEASSAYSSSCPGLSRASTTFAAADEDVDGRDKPGHDGAGWAPRVFRIAVSLAFVLIVVTTAFAAWVVSLGPLPLEQARKVSTTIVDRNGKLLRAYAMADGRWRLPVDAKTAVDPSYLKLLLAYEDRRFCAHQRRRSAGARARGAAARHARPHRLRRLDHHDAAGAADGAAARALAVRKAAPDGARGPDRAAARARTRSSISIWRWRRSAAISKASAPPRSPISARSRSGCRWRKPRCWWRCRNRRNAAGSTAIREAAHAARDRVLDADGRGWRGVARRRGAGAGRWRCRGCASRCRSWRRIPPMPRWRR